MRAICIAILLSLAAFPAWATNVQEVISSKGIKAWLVEEHAVPLVAVKIMFTSSGTATDSADKLGRATLAAAMFTEGAGEYDARAFAEAVESRAIALQAGVDQDAFSVSMETLSEHKDIAFSLMGLSLTAPRMDAESLQRSQRQAISILAQQEQSPGYLAWRSWQQHAFGTHPYSNPPAGTRQTIPAISQDDLRHYYTHYLTRQNMLLAVVGDITPEELGNLLDSHLGALPQSFSPEHEIPDISIAAWEEPVITQFAVPQAMVIFGLPGVARHDTDFFPAYVLDHILAGGGSLTSRLGKELRINKGLTYGIGSTLDLAAHAPVWRGSFATRNEQAGAALALLQDTLRDAVKNGISQKELDDAKQYITGSFVLGLDSNADIARYLISMQLFGLGRDYLASRNAMVEAVTLDQVNAVARRLIDVDRLRVVVVGQPGMEGRP
ncbi:MAG: M16 family metallopeptidase [Alphaproteobacteria bacterium]